MKKLTDQDIISRAMHLLGKRSGGQRPGAGRPPKMVDCPRCHMKVKTTEALKGHPGCQKGSKCTN